MAGIVDMITGRGAKRQRAETKAEQEKLQRRSLAELARQKGEADQAASSGGRKRGGRLLTFLSGEGQETLG